jgi:hypothetical protein
MLHRLVHVIFAAPLCASIAQARDVLIVEGPAAGAYATLQAAINAAQDGNVLLLGPGAYAAFSLDGKGLTLAALPGAAVSVGYGSLVQNVPASSYVVLHGLSTGGAMPSGVDGLALVNNAGHVRLEDCTLRGANSFAGGTIRGGEALWIDACARVALVGCNATGGNGKNSGSALTAGGSAGDGVRLRDSTLALHGCELRGGRGGVNGGEGGDGVNAQQSVLFVAGSQLSGGEGGDALTSALCTGDGGDGWELLTTSARSLDNQFTPGAAGGGAQTDCPGVVGAAQELVQASVVVEPGAARRLACPTFVRDTQLLQLAVTGEPLDVALLRTNRRATWTYGASAIGPLLTPAGPSGSLKLLGAIQPSGALNASVQPRPLAAGRIARVEFLQLLCDDALGARYNASPRHVVVFDDAAGPDCNSNGVPDAFDIAAGGSLDLDLDGQPDECP